MMAVREGRDWVEKVRRVFLLGAPMSGAPLEKLVHAADFTLTPESTAPTCASTAYPSRARNSLSA